MFKGTNRNIKVVLLSIGIYTFSFTLLAPYNAIYAQLLGASGLGLGLLTFSSAFIQGVVAIFLGSGIRKYSLKKIILFGFIIDVMAIIIFISARIWYALIPAFILYLMIKQPPLADVMITKFTELEGRATLMGLARFLGGASSLFASITATMIFTYFGQISAQSIRLLYYISLGPLIIAFLLISKSLENFMLYANKEEKNESIQKAGLLQNYRKLFENRNVIRMSVVRIFRDGSSSLLATYMPLWLVNFKGVNGPQLGILITISTITAIALQIPVGRLADAFGRKKIFYILDIFYCSGVLLSIFASTTEHLVLAAILGMGVGGAGMGGGVGGAIFTPYITIWWESVPMYSLSELYGLDGIILFIARTQTLFGGILWDLGFNALVLLLPVLVELVIVAPLLYTITSHSTPSSIRINSKGQTP